MIQASLKPFAIALVTAASLSTAALAQTPAASGTGGKQTSTQPTANDVSVGIPGQPATMTDNPEAMSPYAARVNGTAPVQPAGK